MGWNVFGAEVIPFRRAGLPVVLLLVALVIHGLTLIAPASEMSSPVVVEAGPIDGPAGRAVKPPRMIEEIRVERLVTGKAGFFFRLNGFTVPECVPVEGEDRKVVCDFLETRLAAGIKLDLEPIMHPPVRMRIGVHHEPVEKTRVVFDLDQSANYDIEQYFVEENSEFVLIFHGVSP
jgi:hypothetical protein